MRHRFLTLSGPGRRCSRGSRPVTINRKRRPPSPEYAPATVFVVRAAVRTAAKAAGMTQRIGGPHIFRHTVAQRLVRGRASLKAVADLWLREQPHADNSPLFPNRLGSKLSRTNVTERLQLAIHAVTATHPGLAKCKVTPHIFRHSLAMHLLHAGVDVSVIALWLGHESPTTTHVYVEADLAMKEQTLKSLRPPSMKALRFRPSDQLMQFEVAPD